MICYRDRQYCQFHESCKKGKACDRALTEKVKSDAEKWWGKEGAPIARATGKPDCYAARL